MIDHVESIAREASAAQAASFQRLSVDLCPHPLDRRPLGNKRAPPVVREVGVHKEWPRGVNPKLHN